MYVEDTGKGPPLLVIHGLGGGAWFFGGFAGRLRSRHRVLAVDLPGTGRSPAPPEGPSIEAWVRALGELVRARAGGPVAIVGHSMGTIVALKAWEAWPALIGSLVFVGGLPEPRPAIRERLAARAADVRANGIAGWGARAAPGNFSAATVERNPELIALYARLFDAQAPDDYAACCDILCGASATRIVPTVRVPCLAITGADDQYASPADVRGFMEAIPAPHREAVIPDCGHLPFLEAPEAFAGTVSAFLESASASA
jgi:pimeloyl-ACP methyl ester carboxylesterase